jgi:uncharacterized membrane protein YeaQ/YmgE (transglycosylase-associated protein family)
MLHALGLENFDSVFLMAVCIAILVGGAVVGYLTDVIMGERGFGPFGNGALAIMGALLGVYARNAYFYRLQGDEMLITAIAAEICATGLLLSLGFAKRWAFG